MRMGRLIWWGEALNLQINEEEFKMANMNWPPEKTFKYQFRDNQELDLVIPLEENSKEKGTSTKKSEVKGR